MFLNYKFSIFKKEDLFNKENLMISFNVTPCKSNN